MIETAADRAALVRDFGSDCLIRPPGGGSALPLRAIFNADRVTVGELDLGVDLETTGPELVADTALVAGVAQLARVEILPGFPGAGHYFVSRVFPEAADAAFSVVQLMLDPTGGA